MNTQTLQLRPDSKGRITLGKLAKGISSFQAICLENGNIILEPYKEIPAREAWLFENPAAYSAVRKGLEDAVRGEVRSLGSFAKYMDEKLD